MGPARGEGRPVQADLIRVLRVVIVDDSPTMRRLIRVALEADRRIRVVAEAGSAREARDAVNALSPDVLTLDVEMPGMDGLEFLARLMRARPMPVVMVSSTTAAGSDMALRALALGAVDCVEKPGAAGPGDGFADLARLVVGAARARVHAPGRAVAPPAPPQAPFDWNGRWILIGASTGGVEAIETVLRGFPADAPPTLITQHMPEQFLASFARRLDALVAPRVLLARDGGRPERGEVHLAPGGETHLELAPDGRSLRLTDGPKRSGHRPSVDVLFDSARPHAARMVAVLLTGMGRDGAEGLRALRDAGATCLGQDEASSVVYGMPRAAFQIGAVERQLALKDIAAGLLAAASGPGGGGR